MTDQSSNSQRLKTRKFARRTPGGMLGGLLGAGALSVIAGLLITVAVTPALALTGATTSSVISFFENLPSHIDPGRLSQPSHIYAKDKDGNNVLLARFYAQNRQMVGWDQISDNVKNAAVAEEDPRFYHHGGVDIIAAARAVVQNVTSSNDSGASTISMQYVRNILIQEAEMLPNKEEREKAYYNATRQDLDRKLKEMRLAISLEKKYSKQDILLGYLNIANYGGQTYGIEAAARAYYSKSAADLTVPEAASLIAIVNSPSALSLANPDNHERNKERRNKIINSMLREGMITKEEHAQYIETPIEVNLSVPESGCVMAESRGLGTFCDYVTRYIQNDKKFGENVEERWFRFQNGGFNIFTTINLDLQQAALEAMRNNAPASAPGIDYGSAAVTLDNDTGKVLAMVQNKTFTQDPELEENPDYTSINFNTDYEYGGSSGFQYGSVVKAFTFAEWIRNGHSMHERVNMAGGRTEREQDFRASCVDGGVYGYGTFKFQNDNNRGNSYGTPLIALDQSLNGGFVSMTKQMDLCGIYDLAESMGMHRAIENPNPEQPNYGTRNLARVPSGVYNGNDEVAPITVAAAYAGFANGGVVCTPVPIEAITDSEDAAVDFTQSSCRQSISPDVANTTLYGLEHYMTNGLGRPALSPTGIPRFGKTGTTDNYKDDWWVGGNSNVTTAVWSGNVRGDVSLFEAGLYRITTNIFAGITNSADAIWGGDRFPGPSDASVRQITEEVPNVDGRSVDEARRVLTAAGFQVSVAPEEDSEVPEGNIVRTAPAGGTQAPSGSLITLYPSSGKVKLPTIPGGLIDGTAQNAANVLDAAGYNDVFMQCKTDASPNPEKTVVSVSPAEGSEATTRSRVVLTLDC
ncbi:transglycosylase domain-containing protein [Canibacter zhoujuaniae]|uniref:transglycosylase domain-containing protein n=1 Tax=Canibacter zhoujuaniae TaxID=2708343 RepID=UPI001422800B|nr:transglycosylase domain-containing protein [Canibacter zhoujuaniae]